MDTTQVSQLAQNIGEVLDQLGARFGATGAHLWEQLVLYQYAQAITGLAIMACLWAVVVGAALYLRGKPMTRKRMSGYGDYVDTHETGWGVARTILLIASGAMLIITVIVASNCIPTLVSPEAATLRSLLP